MKTIEIHMPCYALDTFDKSQAHERWERDVEFTYNGKNYKVFYCGQCFTYISWMHSDYGYFTNLMTLIFIRSGIFFPVKLTIENHGKRTITEYPEDDTLVWVKKWLSRDWEERKELEANPNYELVFDDNISLYYVRKS